MRCWRQWSGCAALGLSLMLSSTSAVASTEQGPAPSNNAWLTLSMLTTSGSAALDGAAVTDAQPDSQPSAPPEYIGSSSPPLSVILVWLSVLGADIYLLTRHHHNHRVPNSPA